MDDWRLVGMVSVDTGCLLVGDPTYLLPRASTGRAGVDYQVVIDTDDRDVVAPFAGGAAVLLQRFGGDGDYPVFLRRDEAGNLSLRIDFVEPEE